MKAAVIGCGAWGTALANCLCKNGFDTVLWCHDATLAREMRQKGMKENKLEEQKATLQEHIRGTVGFKRMLLSGDDNITSVLNNSGKMNLLYTEVTQGIREMTGQNQPQNQNNAPQINNERAMDPAINNPQIMGM